MSILGAHHVSFSVTDIEKTVHFYRDVLGLSLRSRSQNEYEGLGTALFGTKWGLNHPHADLQIAVMELGGSRIHPNAEPDRVHTIQGPRLPALPYEPVDRWVGSPGHPRR